jgi:pyrimidine-nucleoside phosphorylase
VALISDMNQPLGRAVGNALEVAEALDTLRGEGPTDFRKHCLRVAAHLLVLAGAAQNVRQGTARAVEAIRSGAALEKFRALVEAQGGDVSVVDDPSRLPKAPHVLEVPAWKAGYVSRLDARVVGQASVELGAGRAQKGDPIDHRVGILVHSKVGDAVRRGDTLFSIHAATPESADRARESLHTSTSFSTRRVRPLPLFYRTLRS